MDLRRQLFNDGRQDSSTLLAENPLKDLPVPDKDVPKVLFLSVNPDHGVHSDDDSCSLCRLIVKFGDAVQKKNVEGLKRELKVKTLKLSQRDLPDVLELSTLESNFSDLDDELTKEDEELLTFSEVLEMMQLDVPKQLENKLKIVLSAKKIPARQSIRRNGTDETKKNSFFAYTNSKILSEICETLSADEVYGMKEFLLRQTDNDDGAVVTLTAAMSKLNNKESWQTVPGLKDVAFYYIILNMFKESLLNRLYTHMLEYIIEGSRNSLPDPNSRCHMEEAVKKLRRYPLTGHPPGLCIIFAMTSDREGSEKDVGTVKKVFKDEFNYDVFVKLNPSPRDVKNIVAKVSARRNMFYDSLVVWFMGHGTKTYLNVRDGEIHRRTELIQPFVDIEWLKKKPKLFFIQACADRRKSRSSMLIEGPGMRAETDSLSLGVNASDAWKRTYSSYTDAVTVNPLADTLVSYATMWYEKASRNQEGSLYINTLLDSLQKQGRHTSIENVLRQMHYKVNMVALNSEMSVVWKQTPYYECSLQKEFILP